MSNQKRAGEQLEMAKNMSMVRLEFSGAIFVEQPSSQRLLVDLYRFLEVWSWSIYIVRGEGRGSVGCWRGDSLWLACELQWQNKTKLWRVGKPEVMQVQLWNMIHISMTTMLKTGHISTNKNYHHIIKYIGLRYDAFKNNNHKWLVLYRVVQKTDTQFYF